MEQIFLDVVNLSLTASWVIAVVLLLRFVLKPVPRKYVCLLWFVVLFRLLCPVTLESEFSLVPQHEEVKYEIVYTTPQVETNSEPVNNVLNQTVNPVLEQTSAPNPMGSVNPLQVYIFIAAWIWIIGMVILCGYTLISWIKMRHRLAESIPDGDNVYLSDTITSPFVFGILKPKIYLPYGLEDDERRWVLLHEQSHIARKDYIVKPIFWLAVMIHWMNPLVWIAWFAFSRDLELACDERATASMNGNEKWNYSNTLLALAVEKHRFECPVAFSNNGVKQRIERILKYKQLPKVIVDIVLMLLIVLGGLLLLNPIGIKPLAEYEPLLTKEYPQGINVVSFNYGAVTASVENKDEINYIRNQLANLKVQQVNKHTCTQTANRITISGVLDESYNEETKRHDVSLEVCSLELSNGLNMICGKELKVKDVDSLKNLILPYVIEEMDNYPETTFYADLDHDGQDETIIINAEKWDSLEEVKIGVYRQEGLVLLGEYLNSSHAGWGNYFLYEKDGRDYLLIFKPTMYQGYADYTRMLISFDKNGEMVIEDQEIITFSINPEQFDFDADGIYAFLQETENMLNDATLLVSVEDRELLYSTVQKPHWLGVYYYLDWLDEAEGDTLEQKLYAYQQKVYYERPEYLLSQWLMEKQDFDETMHYLDNPELKKIEDEHAVSFEWKLSANDQLIGIYAISAMNSDDFKDVGAGRSYYRYNMVDDEWIMLENSADIEQMKAQADKWAQTYGAESNAVNESRYALLSEDLQKSVDTMRKQNGATDETWMPYSKYARLPIVESYQITMYPPTGQGNDSFTEHHSALIHYEGYDNAGKPFITEELIVLAQEGNAWCVMDGETVIYCLTEEEYQLSQQIIAQLKEGNHAWILDPELVAVEFAHRHLNLKNGTNTAWNKEKQMLVYTVDGKEYDIYLSQPVKNVLQPAYNFWYVNGYEITETNANGWKESNDYYISLEEWAERHLNQ